MCGLIVLLLELGLVVIVVWCLVGFGVGGLSVLAVFVTRVYFQLWVFTCVCSADCVWGLPVLVCLRKLWVVFSLRGWYNIRNSGLVFCVVFILCGLGLVGLFYVFVFVVGWLIWGFGCLFNLVCVFGLMFAGVTCLILVELVGFCLLLFRLFLGLCLVWFGLP